MKSKPKGLDKPSTRTIIKYMSRANTRLYRLSGGRLGKTWRIGAGLRQAPPICLLTTTGRKTGQPRTIPLVYLRDGANIVLVASQGGRPENPMWYLNVVANPAVEIEIGNDRRAYNAHAASGAEHDELWHKMVGIYRDFDTYQSWTERKIPVIVCEPA